METLGPWEIAHDYNDKNYICIDIGKDGLVLIERHKEGYDQDDMKAAHLIAAAPDLLEALEMVQDGGNEQDWTVINRKIEAVLRKARGD